MGIEEMKPSIRIAPKAGCGYWTASEWQEAKISKDWSRMIQIFKERMDFRYFGAINAMITADEHQPTRRYGFAILALDCLLLETLHQFYKGFKESRGNGHPVDGVKRKITSRGSNGHFFCEFLMQSSFVFKPFFESKPGAAIIFYQDIRCGILHAGETQKATLIRVHKCTDDQNKLFEMIGDEEGIILYRDTFQCLLDQEYKEYCEKLKDPKEKVLRKNFVKKMGSICGYDYGDGELV